MALRHLLRNDLFRYQRTQSVLHSLSYCSSSGSSSNEAPSSAPDIPIVSYAPLPEDALPDEPAFRWRRGSNRFGAAPDEAQDPDASASSAGTEAPAAFSSTLLPAAYEVKPKVAPLPEDRSYQDQRGDLQQEAAKKPRPSLFKSQLVNFVPEDQLDLPVPKLVKMEQKVRPPPIPLMEAIRQVKSKRSAKFDETVEVAVRLGVDPKRSDQIVRGAATLPHGSGKVVRVAVFAEDDEAEEARAAGADVVGSDDLISMIMQSGGKLDFDKCVATPAMMPKISKVARILGPRGLMPNPKVGTVTKNVSSAIKSLKQGRVDFRADKGSIVHGGVGKMSFTEEALFENITSFANAILLAKPAGLKKTSKFAGYFITCALSSTMGPGVRVTIPSIAQAVDNYTRLSGVQQ